MNFGEYLESGDTIEVQESQREKVRRWLRTNFREEVHEIAVLSSFVEDERISEAVEDKVDHILQNASVVEW